MVHRQLSCQSEEFYMRSECMNELSCSAGTDHAFIDCQKITLGCAPLDEELVRALSEACAPHADEGSEGE